MSKGLNTKYVTFRSTNQQYCNRKNSHRGDEQKYIQSQDQAMSEFTGRFALPEDTTTGKSYYAPIKKQAVNLSKEGNMKKTRSIPKDEGQSFADILSIFDNKSLD